jgi:nitrate reductase NapE component
MKRFIKNTTIFLAGLCMVLAALAFMAAFWFCVWMFCEWIKGGKLCL